MRPLRWGNARGLPRPPGPLRQEIHLLDLTVAVQGFAGKRTVLPDSLGHRKVVVFPASGKQTKNDTGKCNFPVPFFVCFPPDAFWHPGRRLRPPGRKPRRLVSMSPFPYVSANSRPVSSLELHTQGWCPEAHGLWRGSLRAAQALIPSSVFCSGVLPVRPFCQRAVRRRECGCGNVRRSGSRAFRSWK